LIKFIIDPELLRTTGWSSPPKRQKPSIFIKHHQLRDSELYNFIDFKHRQLLERSDKRGLITVRQLQLATKYQIG
jgi:hypothetical protein